MILHGINRQAKLFSYFFMRQSSIPAQFENLPLARTQLFQSLCNQFLNILNTISCYSIKKRGKRLLNPNIFLLFPNGQKNILCYILSYLFILDKMDTIIKDLGLIKREKMAESNLVSIYKFPN